MGPSTGAPPGEGDAMEKFIEGRIVKCLFDDEPAVTYLHTTALLFGAAHYPTDAYPVCAYHLRLFVRSA
jgi:hypothetical protein